MSPLSLCPPRRWRCRRSSGAAGAAEEPPPRQRDPHGCGEGWGQETSASAGAVAWDWALLGGHRRGIRHKRGDGESLGNCRCWWGQGLCWSLIRLIRLSLCPHRRHPHHLLLPLPATARPGGPHRLRLRHQQPLRQARGDVSTHHCRRLGLPRPGERPREGGVCARGTGTRLGTRHRTLPPAAPGAGTLLPRPSAPTWLFSRQPGHQEEEGAVCGPPAALGAGASQALPEPREVTLPRRPPLRLPAASASSESVLELQPASAERLFYLTYLCETKYFC